MGSNTPATDTTDPQDGSIVALPPEILAMMAASQAEMAAQMTRAESDGAEAPTDEGAETETPALESAGIETAELEADDLALLAAGESPALPATLLDAPEAQARDGAMGEAVPAFADTLAAETSLAKTPADETGEDPALDAEMAALLASLGAAPGSEAPEPAPARTPSEPVEGETVLQLAAVLDLTAATALHAELLTHRGTPLALDASAVKRLGGQCLQLLISANRTWAADGVPLRLAEASEAFERDLGLMGLTADDLVQKEAA